MKMALAAVMAMGCGGAAVPPPRAPALDEGRHVTTVAGVDLSYEVRGNGPLCLGLPGGPGFDAGYLKSLEIERHFTMVYVDFLGTGASGKPPRYSMTQDVESIESLRISLGIEKLCILGHSYGGFVAQRYAIEHPAHVSALILYSTSPVTNEEWQAQIVANMQKSKDEPWFGDGVAAFGKLATVTSQAELDDVLAKILPFYFVDWTRDQATLGRRMAPHKLAFDVRSKRDDEVYDVRAKLASITAPTLVIAADHDFILGVVPSTWSQQGIKDAKLVVIAGAGHFAHLEQPAEFERAIAPVAESLR